MVDTTTHKAIRVFNDGTAGPYIMVPLSQLGQLQLHFNRFGIRYEVEEDAISMNDEPEIVTINFGRDADAGAIQSFLDGLCE